MYLSHTKASRRPSCAFSVLDVDRYDVTSLSCRPAYRRSSSSVLDADRRDVTPRRHGSGDGMVSFSVLDMDRVRKVMPPTTAQNLRLLSVSIMGTDLAVTLLHSNDVALVVLSVSLIRTKCLFTPQNGPIPFPVFSALDTDRCYATGQSARTDRPIDTFSVLYTDRRDVTGRWSYIQSTFICFQCP